MLIVDKYDGLGLGEGHLYDGLRLSEGHLYDGLRLSEGHLYQGRIQGGHPAHKIGKNIICWRKIVIFHTKYPKNFRAYLRSAQFF